MKRVMRSVARQRGGFTLTEVLVAIGIIVLLAAMLVPIISRVRQSSRLVTCIGNLRQIGVAFQVQQTDSDRPTGPVALPNAAEWIDIVFRSGEGAGNLLFCPDGTFDGEKVSPDQVLKFIAHRGNGRGNPNGSRIQGSAGWRETRTGTDDNFTITTLLHPSDTSQRLVVNFQKTSPDQFQAKLLEKHADYHVDAMNTHTGDRFNDLTTSSLPIGVDVGDGPGVGYGYNVMASNVPDARMGKILVMDCTKSVFDFDGFQTTVTDDDPESVIPKFRHRNKLNALLSDGSVQSFSRAELFPILSDGGGGRFANQLYPINGIQGPAPGGTNLFTANLRRGGSHGKR